MRSQLARHVLRLLLGPRCKAMATLSPCLNSSRPPSSRKHVSFSRGVIRIAQPRRTFLTFFQKPPRVLKELEAEPGYEEMLDLVAYLREDARLPTREKLIQAWRAFFDSKLKSGRHCNSVQALAAHHVLAHLSKQETDNAAIEGVNTPENTLDITDLKRALRALTVPPRDDPTDLVNLAKDIFIRLRDMQPAEPTAATPHFLLGDKYIEDVKKMVKIMTQNGQSLQAREFLLDFCHKVAQVQDKVPAAAVSLWVPVLRGLGQEGKQKELLESWDMARGEPIGLLYGPGLQAVMTKFYAERDDEQNLKLWFSKPLSPIERDGRESRDGLESRPAKPTTDTYSAVLKYALRNNQREWALTVYQDLVNSLRSEPDRPQFWVKTTLTVIYQWAFLLLDKGPDQLEQMIEANAKRFSDSAFQPHIGIINALLAAALEKKDAYIAERFFSMASKMGLSPDEETYKLQLEYRLMANDMEGAFAAYQSLKGRSENAEEAHLNKLIRTLCAVPLPDYDKVLDVTSHLESKNCTLHPATVVDICMTFLKKDEHYEVIDTLSLHTAHYSLSERQMVRLAFVDYCLDEKNSTARVWDAYALLRQFFPEAEVEGRLKIMKRFFDLKRADMAIQVFGHMRESSRPEMRPILDHYVSCFIGVGECGDLESMRIVHNMLKMDTTITPNTRLYNALMIGYTGCGMYNLALEFWKEISNSVEGPSYESLEIVFRTYEMSRYNAVPAKALWAKLQKMEIDIPSLVLVAYAACLAADNHLEEVKQLLQNMEIVAAEPPDSRALATVYNAFCYAEDQDEFERWAMQEFKTAATIFQRTKQTRLEGNRKIKYLTRKWKA